MENQFLDSNLDATPQYGEYAGFWQRFVAALIDGIIMYIVQIGVYAIFGISSSAMQEMMLGGGEDPEALSGLMGTLMVAALLNYGIQIAYYAYFESSEKQGTFGKQAMGLVVTDTNGNRITFLRGIGRYFSKILSALTIGIGFIMQPFTDRKQALHDMVAGTLVYKK
jgi:uncharacterized RDD family membrane protein YckC